jgi:glycosyltransferase involved in cell wall biosynthesis
MKLLIIVTTFNRRSITELSLAQTFRFKRGASVLVYDDHSTEYDLNWISQFADGVERAQQSMGIAKLRAQQFRDFLRSDHDLLYFTDNDVIHDPAYVSRLRRLYSLPTEMKLPVSLFNSSFHNHSENILKEIQDVQIRKTAPGVSQLYDREMVDQIVLGLQRSPELDGRYGWDYHLPALLQRPWIQSTTSYLEHFGAGGMHAPDSEDAFERDRALNPTPFLSDIRDKVIHYLKNGGDKPNF